MLPTFRTLSEKKLVGKRLTMTYAENKTFELWHSFMPLRKQIRNCLTTELYSIQVYDRDFNFGIFDKDHPFDKWAAAEVSDFDAVPEGMETLILKSGLYAVFIHKGAASTGPKTFGYIFGTWLPNSEYLLDNRPHFEILGEKYKNDDPESEEEVWIPVKLK